MQNSGKTSRTHRAGVQFIIEVILVDILDKDRDDDMRVGLVKSVAVSENVSIEPSALGENQGLGMRLTRACVQCGHRPTVSLESLSTLWSAERRTSV